MTDRNQSPNRKLPMKGILLSSIFTTLFFFVGFIFYWFFSSGATLEGFRISKDGFRISSNFSWVEKGSLIRSAQLSKDELKNVIQKYHVKTVINLQGIRPGYTWFDDESAITNEMGVGLYSFELATESIPRSKDLNAILDLFKYAPRPILIHCRSGSDRTGLISAIYAHEFMGLSKEEALAQHLSPRFWHSQFMTPAQIYFFRNVYRGIQWVRSEYNHCSRGLRYADRWDCPPLDQMPL